MKRAFMQFSIHCDDGCGQCPNCGELNNLKVAGFMRTDEADMKKKECLSCGYTWPVFTIHLDPEAVKRERKERKEKNRAFLMQHPDIAIHKSMRNRIYQCMKKNYNRKSLAKMVGYTLQELMDHLENQFQPGMTWKNYGEWHIDHIAPLSEFKCDSVDSLIFKKAWALENLQPLWARDNARKNNRVDGELQRVLDLRIGGKV
jgi:Zn ribbon nucleic-acid-binding protein